MVFVTGKEEVHRLVRRLSETFPKEAPKIQEAKELDLDNFEALPNSEGSDENEKNENDEMHFDEDDDEYGECDDFDEEKSFQITSTALDKTLPMVALPLYSVLPRAEQKKIFCEFEEPIRKVVVATNIAETSLTIPGTLQSLRKIFVLF